MSNLAEFLGEQLKNKRKNAALKQAELAEQCGISLALISEIERGIANPTLQTLEKLAAYLGVTVAEMLDSEGSLTRADEIRESIAENLGPLSLSQLRVLSAMMKIASR